MQARHHEGESGWAAWAQFVGRELGECRQNSLGRLIRSIGKLPIVCGIWRARDTSRRHRSIRQMPPPLREFMACTQAI